MQTKIPSSPLAKAQARERRALLEARARHMRHNPTYSEALLFSVIRGKRLGVTFRRQVVIGNHIVDFLVRSAKLVVEIDGAIYHDRRVTADAHRDVKLRRAGFRVLRLSATLVESDLSGAVTVIKRALV